MSSNRKTAAEIRAMFLGEAPRPDGWYEFAEEFQTSTWGTTRQDLAVDGTYFLEHQFPGNLWGWQDLDILLSDRCALYWDSREHFVESAIQSAVDSPSKPRFGSIDVTQEQADAMSPEEKAAVVVPAWSARFFDSVRRPGQVLVFFGIKSISDVRR